MAHSTLGWPASPILVGVPHGGEPCCLQDPQTRGRAGPGTTSRGPCCESVTFSLLQNICRVQGCPETPAPPTSQVAVRHASVLPSPERPAACALP